METIKQKSIVDAQMIKNKESKPTTTENHKGIKQERKKGTKDSKTATKQSNGSKYIARPRATPVARMGAGWVGKA